MTFSNISIACLIVAAFLLGLFTQRSLNMCPTTTTTTTIASRNDNIALSPPIPSSTSRRPVDGIPTGGDAAEEEGNGDESVTSPKPTGKKKPISPPTPSESVCGGSNSSGALPPLPTLRNRVDLGVMMELDDQFDYKIGAELGVQKGHFAKSMLEGWKKAEEYWLVDVWAQQTNYVDIANVNNKVQDENYEIALASTKKWESKIKVCRNFTTSCVPLFKDGYFDFIFVDARHDFKGVLIDIDQWWPKLKTGGVFSGHDYLEQRDIVKPIPRQDWTKNYDGTVDTTGTVVRGAVELFFTNSIWGVAEGKLEELRKMITTPKAERLRNVKLTYKDPYIMSWYCRK